MARKPEVTTLVTWIESAKAAGVELSLDAGAKLLTGAFEAYEAQGIANRKPRGPRKATPAKK